MREKARAEHVRLASFDTLSGAMLCLVQILIGEGWHEVMFALMNAQHTWYWAVYFMIYVLVQTLLLTNLLVGVVLDSTSGFSIQEEFALQQNVLYGEKLAELTELTEMRENMRGGGGSGADMDEISISPASNLMGRRTSFLVTPADLLIGGTNRRSVLTTGVPSPQDPSPKPAAGAFATSKPQLLPHLSRAHHSVAVEEESSHSRAARRGAGGRHSVQQTLIPHSENI